MLYLSRSYAVLALAALLVGPGIAAGQSSTLESPSGVKGYYLNFPNFIVPYEVGGIRQEVTVTNPTGAYVLLVWDDPAVEADSLVWSGYRVRRSIPGLSPAPLMPGAPNGDVIGQFKSRDNITTICLADRSYCDRNYNVFGIGGGFFFDGFRRNRRADGSYVIDYPPGAPEDSCLSCRVFLDTGNLSGFPSRYSVTSIDTTSAQYQEYAESDITEIVEITASTPPADNLEHVAVVPNPYHARAEWDTPGQRQIHFIHLPDRATVRIFTSSLELVRELTLDSSNSVGGITGELAWDMRNADGREVKTGIYLYQVETAQGRSRSGHFVIIK
jgi:hypothetical protein